MSLSLPALAQSAPKQGCPPGSWFCAEVNVAPPVQPSQPAQPAQAAPPQALDDDEPAAPPPPPARKPRRAAPPPPAEYQPVPEPPPQVIVVTPGYGRYAPASPQIPPPPPAAAPRPRWTSEFGFNLRVEGAAIGRGARYDAAGMGGVGLSLRYRPVPHFAFDLGADVLAGTDYSGYHRVEVPVSLNGIIYLNPRSRVQLYLLGGAHISRAQVKGPWDMMSRYEAAYTYFGGQGGGGLEFRLSKRVALNLDAVGFVRTRVDEGAERSPEFIDPETGRTTNTSGGALFRGGLTFWW